MGVKREGQGHLSVLCPPLCGVCLGCPCLCPHPTPRPPPPRYPLLLSLQEPPVRTRELLSSPSTEPPITAWVLLALGELTALFVCVCVCVCDFSINFLFSRKTHRGISAQVLMLPNSIPRPLPMVHLCCFKWHLTMMK